MAAAIIDVYRALDQWAPFDTQMDFDNAGFLVGRGEREVRRVLVSLDITEAVAAEAGRWGAELIVSHHPVIFHPVKALTDQTSTGRTLLLLAEQGIGAVCAHTNLDAAQGGVNDCLAGPWSWTVWNCSAGTGLTDRGGPTASAGLGRPLRPAVPPLNLPPLSRKSSPPAASVSWRRAGRCAGWRWGAAPAPPCSPTPWRRGVTLSSLPT